MNYILFLTKHHDGFCLWDTRTTEFKVTNTKLGVDVPAQLKKSCDKYGLKLALYFSEGDWHWADRTRRGRRAGIATMTALKKAQLQDMHAIRPYRILLDGSSCRPRWFESRWASGR